MGRVVDALVDVLKEAGVARIHGVPGEGSTLDLVDAAAARGLDYVLTTHETAGAFMAAAEAELTPTNVVATMAIASAADRSFFMLSFEPTSSPCGGGRGCPCDGRAWRGPSARPCWWWCSASRSRSSRSR